MRRDMICLWRSRHFSVLSFLESVHAYLSIPTCEFEAVGVRISRVDGVRIDDHSNAIAATADEHTRKSRRAAGQFADPPRAIRLLRHSRHAATQLYSDFWLGRMCPSVSIR